MPESIKEEIPISFRINHSMLRELDALAAETRSSRTELIQEAIASLIGVYRAKRTIPAKN